MYASIGIDEFPLADVRVMCKSLDKWNFGWYIAHTVHIRRSTRQTSVGTLTRRVSGYFETDGRRHSCEA
jgi:hypothetical protein